MAVTLDAKFAEDLARRLLDARMDTVKALVATRQGVADAQRALDEAIRADRAAYEAAVKGGWTPAELREVGISEPGKQPRRSRPRSTKPAAPAHHTPTEGDLS